MNVAGCLLANAAARLRSGLHDGAGRWSGRKVAGIDLIELEILFCWAHGFPPEFKGGLP